MRYSKQKLALFFTVQTLGVGAMIAILRVNLHPDCSPFEGCPERSSLPTIVLATALIVAELAVLAAALRREVPVWYALVGLGAVSLVTAFVCGLAAIVMHTPDETVSVLAGWHVVIGVILLVAGAAAAIWDLLDRLSRRDDADRPGDRQPTAMWPLE